jgi:hypothetical protein
VELTGAALRSWQALAQRHGVATGALVRAVGVYLLDHERLEPRDLEFVLSLARGLEELRPELVDLPAAEGEASLTALEQAIAAVDRAKRILEDAGLREVGRALGTAQTALHDARRLAHGSSRPPGA